MKRLLLLIALCVSFAPIAVRAQAGPPSMQSPSPEQRAKMEAARVDAKAAAYSVLTPAHATAVSGIIAQVTAGSLDRRAAAGQIDAVLTPDEQKAVLAAAEKSRTAMRAAMMGAGAPPPGAGPPPPGAGAPPPPGGPPPGAGPPPPGGGRFGPPSAGRYLLMVSMTPEQRRSLMPRARSTAAP
jgi:hypothetical protein